MAPDARYRKKVPKSVRSYVRSAISRSVETKRSFVNASNANIYANIDIGNVHSLVPALTQGVTQGSRTGNTIELKKVTLRMMVTAVLNAFAPMYADVYVFRRKPNATLANIDTNFLQAGGTSIGYDGDLYPYSGLLSLNEDLYEQLYKRRFKIWNPTGSANQGVQASIDPSFCLTIDVGKYMKKKVMYNDATSTPTNDDVYFGVATTYSNGANSSGVVTAALTYIVETEYTDA